ncbi:hypothetical protein [Pontibacter sp. G13]|uniref:hypothetical protein n=1 Tax=Pontibacter sp. G13 TaxID=3074898 RepID=UPI00288C5E1D|nr:hypothetical protein [Pontibacter sp. G13]WNJ18657.1 hypothetical protein RJD25_27695 [Pontibacter sp. G13]
MKSPSSLSHVTIHTLNSLQLVLQDLSAEDYRKPLDIFNQSSIGKHTRHVIEFFQCLSQQYSSGIINYEQRKRDTRIEQSPRAAAQAIAHINEWLKSNPCAKELILECAYDNHLAPHRVPTTLERELIYNIEHAIHHMAMIRIGLKFVDPQISLPTEFGLAPSTLRYQSS